MDFKREIVKWLLTRSTKEQWCYIGMDGLLYPSAWEVEDYRQEDYGPEGDLNIRIFTIKGSSLDGRLSGRVEMTTSHDDEEILKIEAFIPPSGASYYQQRFFDLCRVGDEDKSSLDPDFGSW